MNRKNQFCSSYINKYLECLRINMPIFGNQHGIDMCSHILVILEFANCPKQNFNEHIDKIKKEQKNKKNYMVPIGGLEPPTHDV